MIYSYIIYPFCCFSYHSLYFLRDIPVYRLVLNLCRRTSFIKDSTLDLVVLCPSTLSQYTYSVIDSHLNFHFYYSYLFTSQNTPRRILFRSYTLHVFVYNPCLYYYRSLSFHPSLSLYICVYIRIRICICTLSLSLLIPTVIIMKRRQTNSLNVKIFQ